MTATTYAVLGLLSVKPWTTYELAQQMEKSLGRIWPRATSKIYEEPKKLVRHGLARASKEKVGKRPRTVYTITAEGRRALAAWLKEPGEGPVLEFEQLLKVHFADSGTTDDLRATLGTVAEWARERNEGNLEAGRSYLAGEGAFPQRAAVNMLVGTFLTNFYVMVAEWAAWATEVVEDWPDAPGEAEVDRERLAEVVARAERLGTRADR